jgi:hypothetical protein
VDGKLGEFEELLTHTLRTVGKGRSHLRPPMGPPMAEAVNAQYDYRQ